MFPAPAEKRRGLSQSPSPLATPPPPTLCRALTLMISTSWSTPLSPGKMGWPRRSSASTQPADHTSEGGMGEGQGSSTHLTSASIPPQSLRGCQEPIFSALRSSTLLKVLQFRTPEPDVEPPGLTDCAALSNLSVSSLNCVSPLGDPSKPLLYLWPPDGPTYLEQASVFFGPREDKALISRPSLYPAHRNSCNLGVLPPSLVCT